MQVIDVLHPGRPNVPKVRRSLHALLQECAPSCCFALFTNRQYAADESLGKMLWLVQTELKEKLGKMYDVRDNQSVFVFGFRTQVCSSACSEDGLKSCQAISKTNRQFNGLLRMHLGRIMHGSMKRLVFYAVWWRQVDRIRPHL